MRKKYTKKTAGLKHGFRSGLEELVSKQLVSLKIEGNYEKYKIPYIKPESKHMYTCDFYLEKDGKRLLIETKGRFVVADRMKHLLVRTQLPHLDIRFVFTNSKAKITKTSKTTYGMWCDKNGFKYADKLIPEEWLKEYK